MKRRGERKSGLRDHLAPVKKKKNQNTLPPTPERKAPPQKFLQHMSQEKGSPCRRHKGKNGAPPSTRTITSSEEARSSIPHRLPKDMIALI